MATNRISVLIDVTVDKANKALTGFRTSVKNADGAVGKLKAGAKSASQSIKANMLPVAAAAGAAMATFAAKSISAASDLQESTNAVNKSFGAAAEGVLEIGENAAESFGLSKAEFNEAAVAFSAFADQIAGPGGDVAEVIGDLTGRAADFASVMNISVAEAATVFRSGLSGETEPLKKFGINLSAAAVEAYALSTGLAASKSEMTESVKVQARYGLLMAKTANSAGDFADTSDGLANSTRIANARFEDFQATVGEELIPVVETALGLVLELADSMEALGMKGQLAGERVGDDGVWDEIKENVEGILNPVAQAGRLWGTFNDTFRDTEDAVEDVSVASGELGTHYGTLTERAEELAVAQADAAVEAEAQAKAVEHATRAMEAAAEKTDTTRKSFENLRRELSDREGYLTVQEGIADAATAQSEGREVTEREILRMKGAVLDYGETLTSEADKERIAEIQTQLNQGQYWAAAIALEQLERTRTAYINVRTRIIDSQNGRDYNFYNDQGDRTHGGGIVKGGIQHFDGLRPDEVPAILQEGEAVLTPEQQGAVLGAGGSGGGPVYNVTVNALDPAAASNAVVDAIRKFEDRNGPGWRS